MKAIGYIRVSTEEQAREGVSLEAQRERIAAWCIAMGHDLDTIHSDEGISGFRLDKRPGLQSALRKVTTSGGVLIVSSMSRLSRSTKETIEISERLNAAGANLVSLSEQIDTTSAAGKMVFRMLAVMNEFERDIISERVRDAMQHKRQQRQRIGKIPFGFDLADDGESLLVNEKEQRVLSLIHRLRKQGESLRAIATELTDRGIPTKEGKPAWSHTAVSRILNRAA